MDCVDSDVQDLTILDTLFSIYEFGTDHLTNSNNTYTCGFLLSLGLCFGGILCRCGCTLVRSDVRRPKKQD